MIKKGLWIVFLLFPTFLWLALSHMSNIWWLENITGVPTIIAGCYAVIFAGLLIIRRYAYSLFAFFLASLWIYQNPPAEYTNQECKNPLIVVQYNLFYGNPNLTPFVNYLKENYIDLVVLQEVSTAHGKHFKALIDEYPHQFGGGSVGYAGDQMVLSKQPLNVRAQQTPEGDYMVTGIWQSREQLPVSLYTAHPPSPRSEQLWHERNALINSLEHLAGYAPYSDTLILGDFNLSSNTQRFKQSFTEYQSAPVQSWPRNVGRIQIPAFTRIGIDHLWLKNTYEPSLFICKREVLSQFSGSDHSAVITYLSER